MRPIEAAGEVLKKHPNILFHVDYVQGIYKVPLAIEKAGIDLCSISGHKFHGLKGTGALIVKEGTPLIPLITGGSQQKAYEPEQNILLERFRLPRPLILPLLILTHGLTR